MTWTDTRTGRRFLLAERLADTDEAMDLFEAQMGVVILEFCQNAGVSQTGLRQIARKIPHGLKLLKET